MQDEMSRELDKQMVVGRAMRNLGVGLCACGLFALAYLGLNHDPIGYIGMVLFPALGGLIAYLAGPVRVLKFAGIAMFVIGCSFAGTAVIDSMECDAQEYRVLQNTLNDAPAAYIAEVRQMTSSGSLSRRDYNKLIAKYWGGSSAQSHENLNDVAAERNALISAISARADVAR